MEDKAEQPKENPAIENEHIIQPKALPTPTDVTPPQQMGAPANILLKPQTPVIITFEKDINISIAISEVFLGGIFSLSRHGFKPRITIEYASGVSVDFNTVENLQEYVPLDPNYSIYAITYYAFDSEGLSARVRLVKTEFDNIYLTLRGPEIVIYKLKEELLSEIYKSVPLYSWIATTDFLMMGLVADVLNCILALYLVSVYTNLALSDLFAPMPLFSSTRTGKFFLIMMVGWPLLGFTLSKVQKYIFPKVVFLLGNEVRKESLRSVIRIVFIAGVVVSVIASFIVIFIQNMSSS